MHRDPGVERALARLRSDGAALFGAPVERIHLSRVRPRAFSSVARAVVSTAGGSHAVYVKVFRSPAGDPASADRLRFRVEREFRETARASEIFGRRPGFAAMRAVAVYPDCLALVTAEIQGRPFSDCLARAARRWSTRAHLAATLQTAERIGRWLRIYQDELADGTRLAAEELREYVDTRLRRLVAAGAGGFHESRRARFLREFDECAADLDGKALLAAPVHADFCPENIFVDQGRVAVIDFAMAKRGLRYLDLSHLAVHLGFRRGIAWRPSALASVKAALFRGFGEPHAERAPGFRLAILVHVAALMADRLNRASSLPAGGRLWLAPQIRRCLDVVPTAR